METDLTLSGNECNRNLSFPLQSEEEKKKIPESQVIHSQENAVREDMNLSQRSKELAFGTKINWLRK